MAINVLPLSERPVKNWIRIMLPDECHLLVRFEKNVMEIDTSLIDFQNQNQANSEKMHNHSKNYFNSKLKVDIFNFFSVKIEEFDGKKLNDFILQSECRSDFKSEKCIINSWLIYISA